MEPERPDPERLARAIAEIDRANADDPNQIEVRGELRPKELAHADLASDRRSNNSTRMRRLASSKPVATGKTPSDPPARSSCARI